MRNSLQLRKERSYKTMLEETNAYVGRKQTLTLRRDIEDQQLSRKGKARECCGDRYKGAASETDERLDGLGGSGQLRREVTGFNTTNRGARLAQAREGPPARTQMGPKAPGGDLVWTC